MVFSVCFGGSTSWSNPYPMAAMSPCSNHPGYRRLKPGNGHRCFWVSPATNVSLVTPKSLHRLPKLQPSFSPGPPSTRWQFASSVLPQDDDPRAGSPPRYPPPLDNASINHLKNLLGEILYSIIGLGQIPPGPRRWPPAATHGKQTSILPELLASFALPMSNACSRCHSGQLSLRPIVRHEPAAARLFTPVTLYGTAPVTDDPISDFRNNGIHWAMNPSFARSP